jgi:hypothetical protein
VAQAFRAEPEAARFFDSMPTFSRNNVSRSITGAKRAETRAKRISEAVDRAKARQTRSLTLPYPASNVSAKSSEGPAWPADSSAVWVRA